MKLFSPFRFLVFAFAAVSFSGLTAAADENWSIDFAAAKKMAAEGKKSIFMEFTGSDWCPPCKKLHAEVLVKEQFLTEVPKQFVLLKLDSPRDKSKQSPEEIAQYKKLSAQYKVTGVPTIILADETGKPYAKLVGYGGQPVEKYVENLISKTKVLTQRNEFLAKAKDAKGVDKAKLLDKAISLIDTELAVSTYQATVKEIISLDGEDKAGLKSKYNSILQLTEIKTLLAKIQRETRGKNDEGIAQIGDLLTRLKPKGEGLQQVLYVKSMMHYRKKEKDEAQKLLIEALKAAPKTKMAANINRVLTQVFKVAPEKLINE